MGEAIVNLAPKAVVIDADGTLFNTAELIYAAYDHVADTHGLRRLPTDEIRAQMGNNLRQMLRTFWPDENPDELMATNSAFFAAHITEVAAFAGMRDLLQSLGRLGLKLTILTGGNHKVHEVLAHHHIEHFFVSVAHSERFTRSKPDPEGFLLAVSECGVEPQQAIMVGDMSVDILTGKNGGAFATIGVTHGFGSRESLEAAGADYIVDDLSAVLQVIKVL